MYLSSKTHFCNFFLDHVTIPKTMLYLCLFSENKVNNNRYCIAIGFTNFVCITVRANSRVQANTEE